MGELILCSQQLAAMPYYIENVSLNVYSLDELCYYIKNNTCLLDADFMDDELCDWVENEQHLPDIAQNLRNIKAGGGVLSEFTGCLMSACGYCTKEEQSRSGIHFRKWNISRHLNVGKSKLTVFWRTGNTSAVLQNTENFCNRVKLKCHRWLAQCGTILVPHMRGCFCLNRQLTAMQGHMKKAVIKSP